ncbi:hypothetical protein KDH_36520 [Dictyobacter sp. S3.2.2.5]|uniref:PRC-barrel domain-containing protein n=1 Tax=Dictyobacter halimunensis TaxID=3026934 RepID=A0ABQ6FW96_9CHLR|nr:hypothetical protein KDH_36520 [Dictyobacter sp. S3.2.2.5]
MKRAPAKMFISDLLGCKIVTAQGKVLGHVLDLMLTAAPEYRVRALMYGRSGLFHRLSVLSPFRKMAGVNPPCDTIPWHAVDSLEGSLIRLKADFDVDQ